MRFSPSGPGFESRVYSNPFSSAFVMDFTIAVSGEGLKSLLLPKKVWGIANPSLGFRYSNAAFLYKIRSEELG